MRATIYCIFFMFAGLLAAPSRAADDIEIETIKVTDGLYMLTGSGGAGNMGVSVGNDGVFLIDDQFAPFTNAIRTAIEAISDKPIKFLLNTHSHPDHTGGNENFGRSGTVIPAHENVRESLLRDHEIRFFDIQVPAASGPALPVITFNSDITFHLNGGEARAFHLPNAHTNKKMMI